MQLQLVMIPSLSSHTCAKGFALQCFFMGWIMVEDVCRKYSIFLKYSSSHSSEITPAASFLSNYTSVASHVQ